MVGGSVLAPDGIPAGSQLSVNRAACCVSLRSEAAHCPAGLRVRPSRDPFQHIWCLIVSEKVDLRSAVWELEGTPSDVP